jgi:uncharacterized repeat protein (TIGR03803 family)
MFSNPRTRRLLACFTVAVATGTLWSTAVATAQNHLVVLHPFASQGPVNPTASLIEATDGNFYGTTPGGGSGFGTVFRMTPGGTVTVLHDFAGGTDGADPEASLVQATDGNFYGTTVSGGTDSFGSGLGTVFRMTPSGTVTVLHSFTGVGFGDGDGPLAPLIQATDGNFYGTTSSGGTSNAGTVFQMTPSGTVTILHAFTGGMGGIDGAIPEAALIQATDGNFYGATYSGGTSNGGTVTVLHTFTGGTDGSHPFAALIQATDGNFYGTTGNGGASGPDRGTVFRMTPAGAVTVLHAFGVTDGANP